MLLLPVLLSWSLCAGAQVLVSVSGNQAFATISLTDGVSLYSADVTITFDTPANLTPIELNLSAALVDPADPSLLAQLSSCTPGCSLDPAFPVVVTVEPLDVPWLFQTGFDALAGDPGNLSFRNTYEFELHTPNLDCSADLAGACPTTGYRLFKAPIAAAFKDVTSEVRNGSVRARGRGGSFSQFAIVQDLRSSSSVEQGKALDLQARIQAAAIPTTLQNNLLSLLASTQVAVGLANYTAALSDLDQLIGEIQTDAGGAIANVWSSDHSLVNDAGDMLGLAQTLRYTLVRLQNGN